MAFSALLGGVAEGFVQASDKRAARELEAEKLRMQREEAQKGRDLQRELSENQLKQTFNLHKQNLERKEEDNNYSIAMDLMKTFAQGGQGRVAINKLPPPLANELRKRGHQIIKKGGVEFFDLSLQADSASNKLFMQNQQALYPKVLLGQIAPNQFAIDRYAKANNIKPEAARKKLESFFTAKQLATASKIANDDTTGNTILVPTKVGGYGSFTTLKLPPTEVAVDAVLPQFSQAPDYKDLISSGRYSTFVMFARLKSFEPLLKAHSENSDYGKALRDHIRVKYGEMYSKLAAEGRITYPPYGENDQDTVHTFNPENNLSSSFSFLNKKAKNNGGISNARHDTSNMPSKTINQKAAVMVKGGEAQNLNEAKRKLKGGAKVRAIDSKGLNVSINPNQEEDSEEALNGRNSGHMITKPKNSGNDVTVTSDESIEEGFPYHRRTDNIDLIPLETKTITKDGEEGYIILNNSASNNKRFNEFIRLHSYKKAAGITDDDDLSWLNTLKNTERDVANLKNQYIKIKNSGLYEALDNYLAEGGATEENYNKLKEIMSDLFQFKGEEDGRVNKKEVSRAMRAAIFQRIEEDETGGVKAEFDPVSKKPTFTRTRLRKLTRTEKKSNTYIKSKQAIKEIQKKLRETKRNIKSHDTNLTNIKVIKTALDAIQNNRLDGATALDILEEIRRNKSFINSKQGEGVLNLIDSSRRQIEEGKYELSGDAITGVRRTLSKISDWLFAFDDISQIVKMTGLKISSETFRSRDDTKNDHLTRSRLKEVEEINRYFQKFYGDKIKAHRDAANNATNSKEKALHQLLAYQTYLMAQNAMTKVTMTYTFAGMVQGQSGGRAISNEDFAILYRALWGGGVGQEFVKGGVGRLSEIIDDMGMDMENQLEFLDLVDSEGVSQRMLRFDRNTRKFIYAEEYDKSRTFSATRALGLRPSKERLRITMPESIARISNVRIKNMKPGLRNAYTAQAYTDFEEILQKLPLVNKEVRNIITRRQGSPSLTVPRSFRELDKETRNTYLLNATKSLTSILEEETTKEKKIKMVDYLNQYKINWGAGVTEGGRPATVRGLGSTLNSYINKVRSGEKADINDIKALEDFIGSLYNSQINVNEVR